MFRKVISEIVSAFNSASKVKVVFIGNQKSGTTAISSLFAKCAGMSHMSDSPLFWEPNFTKLYESKITIKRILDENRKLLRKEVLKEPNFLFFIDDLIEALPTNTKYVYIIRDPRNNIRSLLNRIKVPGNLENSESFIHRIDQHERILFDKTLFRYRSDHYVDMLAERWNIAYNNYYNRSSFFHLVKYEDFIQDKNNFIHNLVIQLGFKPKFNITSIIDLQFQPKGDNSASWQDFYGEKTLARIENICRKGMLDLRYPV